jgi:hypothetical protein
VEINDAESMRVTRAVLPDEEQVGETKLRRCLVGFGDEVRRGVIADSPMGPICSLPVVIDDSDEDDR